MPLSPCGSRLCAPASGTNVVLAVYVGGRSNQRATLRTPPANGRPRRTRRARSRGFKRSNSGASSTPSFEALRSAAVLLMNALTNRGHAVAYNRRAPNEATLQTAIHVTARQGAESSQGGGGRQLHTILEPTLTRKR